MSASHDDVLTLFQQHDIYPRRLVESYPHVLAAITDAWASPASAEACFEQLMLAEPRRKVGFPDDVMSEIFAIAKLYDQLHLPSSVSPFDFWTRALEASDARHGKVDEA